MLAGISSNQVFNRNKLRPIFISFKHFPVDKVKCKADVAFIRLHDTEYRGMHHAVHTHTQHTRARAPQNVRFFSMKFSCSSLKRHTFRCRDRCAYAFVNKRQHRRDRHCVSCMNVIHKNVKRTTATTTTKKKPQKTCVCAFSSPVL